MPDNLFILLFENLLNANSINKKRIKMNIRIAVIKVVTENLPFSEIKSVINRTIGKHKIMLNKI